MAHGALRQRHQRQRAALAVVVGAQDEQHVLERDDDDQRPEDQRHDAEHHLAGERAAGRGRGRGSPSARRAGSCRCRRRRRRRSRASGSRSLPSRGRRPAGPGIGVTGWPEPGRRHGRRALLAAAVHAAGGGM